MKCFAGSVRISFHYERLFQFVSGFFSVLSGVSGYFCPISYDRCSTLALNSTSGGYFWLRQVLKVEEASIRLSNRTGELVAGNYHETVSNHADGVVP